MPTSRIPPGPQGRSGSVVDGRRVTTAGYWDDAVSGTLPAPLPDGPRTAQTPADGARRGSGRPDQAAVPAWFPRRPCEAVASVGAHVDFHPLADSLREPRGGLLVAGRG